jgi:methyltransferase (TIGR00027 family)
LENAHAAAEAAIVNPPDHSRGGVSGRLFDDPLAAALAGPEGFAWLERMEPAARVGGPGLYAVIRTRFFDDFLLDACWRSGVR